VSNRIVRTTHSLKARIHMILCNVIRSSSRVMFCEACKHQLTDVSQHEDNPLMSRNLYYTIQSMHRISTHATKACKQGLKIKMISTRRLDRDQCIRCRNAVAGVMRLLAPGEIGSRGQVRHSNSLALRAS
jgi:hypothetical protein